MGGDRRQIHLFELMKNKYKEVDLLYNQVVQKSCKGAYDVIILPLPVSRDNEYLFAPYASEPVPLETMFQENRAALFLGGIVNLAVKDTAGLTGAQLIDYYEDNTLLLKNAALTAEGAIEILLKQLQAGQTVLVLGFGRIGKALCRHLHEKGIPFCITARNEKDFCTIETLGYNWKETEKLKEFINEYDYIVNTVPAPVLTASVLEHCKTDCKILELASSPYGTDFGYCDRNHLHYEVASGIPGKQFPVRAAEAIYESIEQILEKRGLR